MKKILFVITKANWGGAQRYVFDLATHLPKAEFDVGVVYGTPGLLADKLKESGTTIYRSESMGRDVSLVKDIKSFFELIRFFRTQRPDIVHLNSSKAGAVGALAARIAGVEKIIFTVHGWPFLEDRNPVVRGAVWLASYLTAELCHTVICISDFDLAKARNMPGVHAVRIYNGVEPLALRSGDIVRRAFPPGAKITGTIGELNHNKNQIALIEAARNRPDMYVAIVGEGELRGYLEKKIKEYGLEARVKLLGFILQPEVLRGFDEFALPSTKEGLPYVLLDAKMAGLPIVANRVGGVGEILDAPDMSEFTLARMVEKTIELYR
jgi:glycosyltransferase involved in cell wall biosynthesis